MSLREYIEARCIPVPFSGCWFWLLSTGSHGYGNAFDGNTVTTAPRLSYFAFKGEIPDGMLVQHSCDERLCVNPDHLSLGTDATNAWDKQVKGRAAKKLTFNQVIEIRIALRDGASVRGTARVFGISQKSVQVIRDWKKWQHAHDVTRGVNAPLEQLTDEQTKEVDRLLAEAAS